MFFDTGRLDVIAGGILSGKTELLRKLVERERIAKRLLQVFVAIPAGTDSRKAIEPYAKYDVAVVSYFDEFQAAFLGGSWVIAIDNAHFLRDEFFDPVMTLVEQGRKVLISGLDMDFKGADFGLMPRFMARADNVTKLHAVCDECGEAAVFSQRLVNGMPAQWCDPLIDLRPGVTHIPKCRKHLYIRK